MPQTVLLAEDDRAIRHALERALSLEGYQVTAVADGVEALAQAHKTPPDVLVLDVMMPGIDGLQVCRVLRAEGDRTPILMLTALVETADRIAGLDAGADDYVVKPFDVDEVFARLRALLRRSSSENGAQADAPQREAPQASDRQIEAAGLRMDVQARRAWRGESSPRRPISCLRGSDAATSAISATRQSMWPIAGARSIASATKATTASRCSTTTTCRCRRREWRCVRAGRSSGSRVTCRGEASPYAARRLRLRAAMRAESSR